MTELTVHLLKLRKYASEHAGYELVEIGRGITLFFEPNFPEALEKCNSESQPRITMYGVLEGDIVRFVKVEIEDSRGQRVKDNEEAVMTYKSWLDYIEENY